jgi:hypothetical protein
MIVPRKLVAAMLVAIAVVASARVASAADDAAELERGKNSYDAGRYPDGLRDPDAIKQARAYYAACLIAIGNTKEADRQFELILRDDPAYRPDPVIFPGKVVDRFTDVRARVQADIEAQAAADRTARDDARRAQAAYIRTLQQLASKEVVTERHSRWLALVPFGVGQFQNGQTALGWTFLASETLAAGAWGVSMGEYLATLKQAADAPDGRRYTFDDDVSTWRSRANLSLGVFSALAVAGIVHAEITFVPDARETKPRPLPAPPAGLPTASLVPGGAMMGFVGTF